MYDKLWGCLQRLGAPPYLQHVVKAMHTAVYANIRINGNTHGEVMWVMSIIGVEQGCPLSPTLFTL
jgi:hypothetical protein